MKTNKMILEYCPNFDKIVNADFLEDDVMSSKLVHIYKNFIFQIDLSNEEDIENVKELDVIMGKYVDDYTFRKTLQDSILSIKIKNNVTDAIRVVVDAIIRIFNNYELESTRKIYISKWI